MPQLATQTLSVETAKGFIDNVAVHDSNLYLGISHIEPWADDSNPPQPLDTIDEQVNLWRGLIAGKKVNATDLTLVIPNTQWTNNTVYAAYTDVSDIYDTNFYVLTSSNNLYKCLANNSNSPSTVMPTYTSVNTTHQEVDGYIWKYMLTLGTAAINKFLTASWVPVAHLTIDDGSLQWKVQEAAVPGGLHVINVVSGGFGYTNTANLQISISGDGTSATAVGNVNSISQTVSTITMTSPGSFYHWANVTISGGGGTGATAVPVISPFNGHGYDVTTELGASSVMINIQLEETEGGKITVENDYRQIALIENPLVFGTTNVMSNAVFSQVYTVQVSAGPGDYILDEYVFQGPSTASAFFSGRVTDWDTTNNIVELVDVAGIARSLPLVGANSGISRFTIDVLNPDVVPYSGQTLYIENIQPIQRAVDQTESITTVISF